MSPFDSAARRARLASIVWWGLVSALSVATILGVRHEYQRRQTVEHPRFPNIPDWILNASAVDLSSLKRRVPPARNAAAYYGDAFFEISTDPEFLFDPEEVEYRLPLAKRRSERISDFLVRSERNRAEDLRVARDEVLEECADLFKKLARAQRRADCFFELEIGFAPKLWSLHGSRLAAALLAMHAQRALESADLRSPLRDFAMAERMSRDLRSPSYALGFLGSFQIDRIAYDRILLPLLADPSLGRRQCDDLLATTRRRLDADDKFADMVAAEYVSSLCLARLVSSVRQQFDPTRPGNWPKEFIPLLTQSAEGAVEDERELGVQANALIKGVSHSERLFVIQNALQLPADARPLVHSWLRPLTRVLEPHRKNQMLWGVMACQIAVRRWRSTHAEPAADLAVICGEAGLSEVPSDPYGEGPLKLGEIDGVPVIYSVGPDGKDDGGLIGLDDSQSHLPEPGDLEGKPDEGDWVYYCPL